MALDLSVERSISAPREVVWDLLTDGDAFASWNDAVVSLEGRIAPGEKIALVSTVAPKRTFTLTVTEFDPPARMVWSDGMPLGLFTGRRTYTLEPHPDGCAFTMREKFTGPLAGLISRFVPDMTDSFATFADSLRAEAEKRA